MPSEVFPVNMRTTGHGIAAGVGKLGAFIGVFLVPQLQTHIQLRGMLLVAGAAAILGFLFTLLLPEPALRSLEEISGEGQAVIVPLPNDRSVEAQSDGRHRDYDQSPLSEETTASSL
jgi:hypothetical protein